MIYKGCQFFYDPGLLSWIWKETFCFITKN